MESTGEKRCSVPVHEGGSVSKITQGSAALTSAGCTPPVCCCNKEDKGRILAQERGGLQQDLLLLSEEFSSSQQQGNARVCLKGEKLVSKAGSCSVLWPISAGDEHSSSRGSGLLRWWCGGVSMLIVHSDFVKLCLDQRCPWAGSTVIITMLGLEFYPDCFHARLKDRRA